MNFNKYKVISFDIFDTLVSRRIYRPKDLFSLMQSKIATMDSALSYGYLIDNFSELRIKAESDARERKVSLLGGEPEILITDIYNEISQKCPDVSPEFIEELIKLEIECEKSVLYKCNKGFELFTNAKKSEALVLLISDMYLPSKTLREILISCGYDIEGIKIFSSREETLSKHSGSLYDHVKERLNINNTSWIHIGDNKHADISNAKMRGISTLYADWSEYSHERSYHWKSKDVIGESLYKSVNLKQVSYHYDNNPLSEIGFKVFGPLLLGYISWSATQLKKIKLTRRFFWRETLT